MILRIALIFSQPIFLISFKIKNSNIFYDTEVINLVRDIPKLNSPMNFTF